ncbi:MAG: ParA family protein [Synechococcaceae cyanobacterium RL_1_2]|nr:ParA family protein [Synechococcaceae cyanobacterium RL_1_2]
MAYIISTVNMKGGVGKTTLTVNFATSLVKNHGKRVLVVDLDAQISATLSLLSPHEFAKIRKGKRTLSHLLDRLINPRGKNQALTVQDVVRPYVCNLKGLDLLPGDIELYDEYMVSQMLHMETLTADSKNFQQVWNNFERVLIRDLLAPIQADYDFIILDCAPGYNLLTRSGIAASNFYLLPARPEPLSVIGIQLLERRIAKLKENHKEDIPINIELLGIVFILSGSSLLNRYYNQVMKRVRQDFKPTQIFNTQIPMDVNVAKSLDKFMPVVLAHPTSKGAKYFGKLTDEVIQRLDSPDFVRKESEDLSKVSLKNL